MTLTDLTTFIQFFQMNSVIKFVILIILALYVVFAFVVFNQVKVMNKVISTPPVSTILAIISFIHLLVAFSLFLFSLVIL